MKQFLLAALLALCLIPGALAENAAPATASQVQTYEQLLTSIREVRAASGKRIERFANLEKVRESWETGKLIDEHVLQNKERAGYGQQVIKRLSKDLHTGEAELYYMLRFFRLYPILPKSPDLNWSDYRELLSVKDEAVRKGLEERIAKENWDIERIREEIRKLKSSKNPEEETKPKPKLIARLGKVGTYKIVKAKAGPEAGKLVIDLGFSNYYKTSKDLRFKEGDILESIPALSGPASAPSDKIRGSKRLTEDLYTYRAYVFDIVDGDTIKAVIDLGFGVRSVQTLRLRGLDAPEMNTTDGKKAKSFLEKMLTEDGKSKPVLIRTVRSDKYDRYLANVFVDGVYINQKLLDEGLAVQMQE